MDWIQVASLSLLVGGYLWFRCARIRRLSHSFIGWLKSEPEEVKIVFTRPGQQKKRPGVLIDGVPYRDITDERSIEKFED